MAIQITIIIPGELSDPTSSVSRLKAAIDWKFEDDPDAPGRPQNAAEYKQFVADWLVRQLKHDVRLLERERQRAQLDAIDIIDIQGL